MGAVELAINDIRYWISIPKYPKSSLNSILYIINMRGYMRAKVEVIYRDISNYFITSCELVIN